MRASTDGLPVKMKRSDSVRSPKRAQNRLALELGRQAAKRVGGPPRLRDAWSCGPQGFPVAAAWIVGLAVGSEEVGAVSTAHEGGGVVLHQLSAASGHGRCDLGHVAADAIQQLLKIL